MQTNSPSSLLTQLSDVALALLRKQNEGLRACVNYLYLFFLLPRHAPSPCKLIVPLLFSRKCQNEALRAHVDFAAHEIRRVN